jgi:hypothetical protein
VLRPSTVKGDKHEEVFVVRPGSGSTRVADVDFDRSSVEGEPLRGDKLDCDDDVAAASSAGNSGSKSAGGRRSS